jgi:diguanylate cyclase (GGDEF)-like protein
MIENNIFLLHPTGIVVIDDKGRLITANPAALCLLEWELPQAVGRSLQEVLPTLFDRDDRFMVGSGQAGDTRRRTAIKYGPGRRLSVDLDSRTDQEGRHYLFLSQRVDRPNEALQPTLPQHFEIFLDKTPDFIHFKVIDGARHEFVAVSQSMATLCGFSNWRDMIGLDDFDAFPAEFAETYYSRELEILASGKALSFRETYLGPNERVHWVNSLKTPIFSKPDQGPTYLFGISRNIDELVMAEGKVLDQARRDPLTGVLNRRTLSEDMRTHIGLFDRYRHKFSMLLFDIDAFKAVNDTYGHAIGDSVLSAVVNLILEHCRETDRLYRMGGDEFVLLMPETGGAEAVALAERILAHTREYKFEQVEAVTLSVGAAEHVAGENDADFFARCDGALYLSKRSGRNCVSLAAVDCSVVKVDCGITDADGGVKVDAQE